MIKFKSHATISLEEGVCAMASWKNEAANSQDEARVIMEVVEGRRMKSEVHGARFVGSLLVAGGASWKNEAAKNPEDEARVIMLVVDGTHMKFKPHGVRSPGSPPGSVPSIAFWHLNIACPFCCWTLTNSLSFLATSSLCCLALTTSA